MAATSGGLMSTDPDDAIRAILAKVQSIAPPRQRKLDTCEIDRLMLEEHKARATARSKPAHAEPAARPGRKRKTVGRPTQMKEPLDGLDLVTAFSIVGAKAKKRREKLEKFGPGEARGISPPKTARKGAGGAENQISNCGPLQQRVSAPKDQGS